MTQAVLPVLPVFLMSEQRQMKLQKKAELDEKRAQKRQKWTEARKKKLQVN